MIKIYQTTAVENHNNLKRFSVSKAMILLAVFIAACGIGKAQVTVNPGGTPYGSLNLAFNAINAGAHTGALTININSGYTETVMPTLNSSGTGAANYTSIIIKPIVPVTITGSLVAMLKLNGADNVTIDGAVSGTTRDLTFNNTSTNTASGVIWTAEVLQHRMVQQITLSRIVI